MTAATRPKSETATFALPGLGFDDALITLRRAVEAGINGIVISDARLPDIPIVHVNPAFERMTGYLADEVVGRNCRFLQGPGTDASEVARLRAALEAGEPCSVKLRNHRKDGSAFWNRLDVSPIRDDRGRLTHFIGVQLDITREIEAEEARQAEQRRKLAVMDAVGDIAHDIKNMMAPVEGWAALLADLVPECRAGLDQLSEGADAATMEPLPQLLDLIPEALEGIRGGSEDAKDRGAEIADALKGNLRTPRFTVRDIAETASRVMRTLKPRANALGTHVHLEGSCAPFAFDRVHLYNAIYNLPYNALAYAPGGVVRLRIVEREGHVIVEVRDTGAGIAPEVLPTLFTDHAISTTPGGTGLGTRIVASVAAIHGGRVEVVSKVGEGTRVRMILPMHRDDGPNADQWSI
ncbi:MAG: PAS domain-containing protein [Armatimonadetes bacterium]|nr:PAS domain-containing protein [Armatimonadota bacterium]